MKKIVYLEKKLLLLENMNLLIPYDWFSVLLKFI
jgi:hypothetical protein